MLKRLGLTTLASFALVSAAEAAEHTLLIYETPNEVAARTDPARSGAYWAGYADFARAMTEAGVLRGGATFTAPGEGRAVGPVAVAGPATPTGYFTIEASDMASAQAWAARAPAARTGHVVVFANLPMQAR